MDALKRSIGQAERETPAKGKKPRKAAAGQKEMLLPISNKRGSPGRGQEGARNIASQERVNGNR
jgi:DNA end-binding protein Ku